MKVILTQKEIETILKNYIEIEMGIPMQVKKIEIMLGSPTDRYPLSESYDVVFTDKNE